MKILKVFVVCGHGKATSWLPFWAAPLDVGAVSKIDGTTEREIVLKVGELIKKYIDPKSEIELQVIGGNPQTLKRKIKAVNAICTKEGLDSSNSLLISLHANSASPRATGVECFYYNGSDKSKDLAKTLCNQLASDTGLYNRGCKNENTTRFGRLGIIHDTKPLAVLLELGFLSNGTDLKLMKEKPGLFADAIIKGINKFIDNQ